MCRCPPASSLASGWSQGSLPFQGKNSFTPGLAQLEPGPRVWCGAAERGQCQGKDEGTPAGPAPAGHSGLGTWRREGLAGTMSRPRCSPGPPQQQQAAPSQPGQPSPWHGDVPRKASAPCHSCDVRATGSPAPTEARSWSPTPNMGKLRHRVTKSLEGHQRELPTGTREWRGRSQRGARGEGGRGETQRAGGGREGSRERSQRKSKGRRPGRGPVAPEKMGRGSSRAVHRDWVRNLHVPSQGWGGGVEAEG